MSNSVSHSVKVILSSFFLIQNVYGGAHLSRQIFSEPKKVFTRNEVHNAPHLYIYGKKVYEIGPKHFQPNGQIPRFHQKYFKGIKNKDSEIPEDAIQAHPNMKLIHFLDNDKNVLGEVED